MAVFPIQNKGSYHKGRGLLTTIEVKAGKKKNTIRAITVIKRLVLLCEIYLNHT